MTHEAEPRATEYIQPGQGEVLTSPSASAPFIYFDQVPVYGLHSGVGAITLTAQRQIGGLPDGSIAVDRVITGLLRGNIPAMRDLREAINKLLLMAEPTPTNDLN